MADLPTPFVTPRAPTVAATPTGPTHIHTVPAAGVDWQRAGRALLRRRWLVIAVTLLATAGGVFGARLLHPQYEAQATIWIDQGRRDGGSTPLSAAPLFDAQGWAQLLVSNTILDTVVVQRHLWVTSRVSTDSALFASVRPTSTLRPGRYQLQIASAGTGYTLADANRQVIEHGTIGDSIGRSIGIRWAPPAAAFAADSTYSFTVVPPQAAAIGLAGALQPSISQDGSYLTITLAGANPVATAATLNAIAARYVDVANRLQRERLTELTNTLVNQIQYAGQSLADAEQQLQTFRVRTITGPQAQVTANGTGSGPAASDLSPDVAVLTHFHDLQTQLDAARADRAALAPLAAAAAKTGISVADYQSIPSVQQTPELMAALAALADARNRLGTMQVRYTNEYPDIQRLNKQIAALTDTTIPRLTRGILDRLASTTASLTTQVAQTADSLRQLPPRATQQARLMRQVALATSLYDNLQQRYGEAQIAMASSVANVHVLDPAAVPPWPTKNTTPRIIGFALVAGLGVAMLLAVLLDRWDPRFRYPSQVTGEMGLAILGTIPHVASTDRDSLGDTDFAFREAIRGLRMNVSYAYGAAGPVMITVTSPGSRDGKSFLALNLARTFAEGGARTLLIDGDVRRGTLHRRAHVTRKPGLTDYLRGGLRLDDIWQPTRFEGVSLITSGTRLHEAPELLASSALRTLIADLRDRFDVIVCDSPPLSAGIDAFALAVATGNMLLVLRTGVSDREMAQAKLDVLKRMPVRLLGAVLNDVPQSAPYAYYSNYLPGYETESERHPAIARALNSESD